MGFPKVSFVWRWLLKSEDWTLGVLLENRCGWLPGFLLLLAAIPRAEHHWWITSKAKEGNEWREPPLLCPPPSLTVIVCMKFTCPTLCDMSLCHSVVCLWKSKHPSSLSKGQKYSATMCTYVCVHMHKHINMCAGICMHLPGYMFKNILYPRHNWDMSQYPGLWNIFGVKNVQFKCSVLLLFLNLDGSAMAGS